MKKIALVIVSGSIWVKLFSTALALNLASPPTKFPIPWGNSAGVPYIRAIPVPSQIGITNCAASLTDGFPPLTFQPVAGGGCAPFGQDFNGIFNQITLWSRWYNAGGTVIYDSSFVTSISGYPRGAILSQSGQTGCFWIATTDAVINNPDPSGAAGWTNACPGGGIGTTASTGTANAQVVTTTPFLLQTGSGKIAWLVGGGLTNTGATQINVNGGGLVNLYRRTPQGLTALSGGELVAGQWSAATWDGTQWELDESAAWASLQSADQTLNGGANVTSLGLATGNITVDCGARPLQYIANTGGFTITAPANDGSCMLQVENGAGAAIPAFSGFTVSSNTGDAFTTTNGSKFVVSIWRIHAISSYVNKALQ
jgi:hypothetical protein